MRPIKMLACCVATLFLVSSSNAQGFLKKMKQKVEQASDKVIDKKIDDAVNNQGNGSTSDTNAGNSSPSNSGNKKGKPSNKGGEGLISTPPNVPENLASAETAFKNAHYGDARYAVRQAMLGVELEIGRKILESLPPTVAGLKKDTASDQVTSTGWGWAGLTIQRIYNEGDKQLTFTIANNSTWMQAVNLFLTNGGYMQTSGKEQKWKQTKIQNERAVIEFDQNTGYKLSVPLGQTSLLVYEGINFSTEQEFMNGANQIDIARIKKQLGEK